MIQFVDNVIIPYIDDIPLSEKSEKTVAIFDVYKAHRDDKLLNHLKANNIIPLFVPAACTDKLQSLDLSVNHEYKEILKTHFHDWYSAQVVQQLNDHEDITGEHTSSINVDLKTSVVKSIHAEWLISTHKVMETRTDLIQSGFRKAGLLVY